MTDISLQAYFFGTGCLSDPKIFQNHTLTNYFFSLLFYFPHIFENVSFKISYFKANFKIFKTASS